jgi:hypothetical protein
MPWFIDPFWLPSTMMLSVLHSSYGAKHSKLKDYILKFDHQQLIHAISVLQKSYRGTNKWSILSKGLVDEGALKKNVQWHGKALTTSKNVPAIAVVSTDDQHDWFWHKFFRIPDVT